MPTASAAPVAPAPAAPPSRSCRRRRQAARRNRKLIKRKLDEQAMPDLTLRRRYGPRREPREGGGVRRSMTEMRPTAIAARATNRTTTSIPISRSAPATPAAPVVAATARSAVAPRAKSACCSRAPVRHVPVAVPVARTWSQLRKAVARMAQRRSGSAATGARQSGVAGRCRAVDGRHFACPAPRQH